VTGVGLDVVRQVLAQIDDPQIIQAMLKSPTLRAPSNNFINSLLCAGEVRLGAGIRVESYVEVCSNWLCLA
jgi:hypothetical protein